MDDALRWKQSAGSFSRMKCLKDRQRILQVIREDLYDQNFLEVETPLLVKATCPDPYIDSIKTEEGYLITSTEYQIKRLMAGGFEKVFTLTKNFRANDRGRYHSSEFTMLEWARAGESLQTIEEDTVRFVRKAFSVLYPDQTSLNFQGNTIDFLSAPWETLTVRKAFDKYLGLNNLKDFSLEALASASKAVAMAIPSFFEQDKHLMMAYLLDQLQPHLGKERPTFLKEWPSYLASSAPLDTNDPSVAERTELYIGGIEIANGFPFLRDAELQRKFFKEALQIRKEEGKPSVVLDEHYLASLEKLPMGAGIALGVDRLVMVLTGASQLTDIQAFGWDEL